jgi:hypothetical protein
VTITIGPDNVKLVQWRLSPSFKIPGDQEHYYLEFARAGDDWERLNTLPIVDECCATDAASRRVGIRSNAYYRVVLDDGINEYPSQPAHLRGKLNTHDWLVAREIMRGTSIHLQKGNGNFGWLLKRRHEGLPCPHTDPDTGEPIGCCDDCYGTGYVGGYYKPIPYWVDLGANINRFTVHPDLGPLDPSQNNTFALAWPELEEYDIWVDADTNTRYLVDQIDEAVKIRDVPMVYGIRTVFKELPRSDEAYGIPLLLEDPEGSSTPASSTVGEDCDEKEAAQLNVDQAPWGSQFITFADYSE